MLFAVMANGNHGIKNIILDSFDAYLLELHPRDVEQRCHEVDRYRSGGGDLCETGSYGQSLDFPNP